MSLSGGFPPPSLFPFSGISLQLASGGSVHLSDVAGAQQYNFSLRGYQPLLLWAERHVASVHAPPAAVGHTTLITNGGNHTLEVSWSRGGVVGVGLAWGCERGAWGCGGGCGGLSLLLLLPHRTRACNGAAAAPPLTMHCASSLLSSFALHLDR